METTRCRAPDEIAPEPLHAVHRSASSKSVLAGGVDLGVIQRPRGAGDLAGEPVDVLPVILVEGATVHLRDVQKGILFRWDRLFRKIEISTLLISFPIL